MLSRQELGDNVRFSNHINKKDLYWKVSALRMHMAHNQVMGA